MTSSPPDTVPARVVAQARRTPDAVAVESAGHRLTYGQLLAEASGLARRLLTAGVVPGEHVAVAVPRGVDLLPALLGVQLAGAAYVPLDPDHPADRLAGILTDSGARVLVTADAAGARELPAVERVRLDDVAPCPDGPPAVPTDPGSTAYVVYTSGSTGRPKGVVVTHGSFANFADSMRERPGLADGVVLPAVTTVSFDIAALELFLPLTGGGRVVVARPEEATDPRRLAAFLAEHDARLMQATPVTWRLLLEAGWSPPPGFTVLCGGERLPAELADRLLGEDVVLWDLYGPTETTVWSSVTRHARGEAPRFHPVLRTRLHVLDARLRPVEDGDVGELYIAGAGVAVGYWGRRALTAARFVADPWDPAGRGRLYRTGDLARRHPGGRIEILGREDDQLKVRGFRIEPGEIEHVLARHPDVAEAAVRAVGEGGTATRLVGYVRPADPSRPPEPRGLRLHLARSLPAYMVPAQFVVLDRLPRTANGKLHRPGLPLPEETPRSTDPVDGGAGSDATADATGDGPGQALDLSARIATVVADVLDRPSVDEHEDFFALGGDSLLAVQIVLRLNQELETEVPINALFEARTVYGLAALLGADETSSPQAATDPGSRGRLSAAQWRLWLRGQAAPDSPADNGGVVVRLPGELDVAAARAAVTGLLARHDALRTRYEVDEDELPVAVLEPAASVAPEVLDGDPETVLAAELARPFDLAAAPPLRVRLVRDADGRGSVVLVVHRIAADDRSREILASEVSAAYRGRTVPTPPLGYRDVAEWQRTRSSSPAAGRDQDFWRATLAGLDPPGLDGDRPRPARRDGRCGTVRFEVPAAVVGPLVHAAADVDATPAQAFLAVLHLLLARVTGRPDVTVGVPAPGRDRPELEGVVGPLEETTVVRVDLTGDPAAAEVLVRVRSAALAAAEHALLPFEDVVAAAAPGAARPGRTPLYDVAFAHHRVPAGAGGAPPDPPGSWVDLACHLTERPDGGVDGRFVYATQVFDEPTVRDLVHRYVGLVDQVGADPSAPVTTPVASA